MRLNIAVLFFLVVFAWHPQSVFAQEGKAHATISIIDGRFEPKTLFIAKGMEVEWVNLDTKKHWPASNNHPTHRLYPGSGIEKCGTAEAKSTFDACHGLAPGESWSFVFEHTGEWNYHDHLFPSLGGVIHVFETEDQRAKAEAATRLSWWQGIVQRLSEVFRGMAEFFKLLPPAGIPSPAKFRALSHAKQQATLERLAEYDAAKSWQYLKDVAFEGGTQVIDAHELAHIVGNALYREKGFAGIGVCDSTFAYGCYHGVAEKFLATKGPGKAAEAAETCWQIFPKDSQFQEYASCVHGLGHGLLTWYALDLNAALRSCEAVPDVVKSNCYDGVFMEFSFSASRNQYPVDAPWSFCEKLDDKYHIACARYQPVLMHSILGLSTEKIARMCLTANTSVLREHCVSKLGFDAASQNKGDAQGAVTSCSTLFSDLPRAQCITAAAKEFVFQEFPNWKEASSVLCNALVGGEREQCFAVRDDTITKYGR